jgi:type IV pilus assembly protein PilV
MARHWRARNIMSLIKHQLQRNGSGARGFTLVEVLVSLVILSIGLLGIAKLMLLSSHSNDSAYLRSQATDLAYQMLDYMRSNIAQAGSTGTPPYAYTTLATTAATDPGFTCVAAAACANLAAYDVYQWKLRLNANNGVAPPGAPGALPNGQGSVTAATAANGQTTVTIVVSWDDSVAQSTLNPGAAANTQSVTLESVL